MDVFNSACLLDYVGIFALVLTCLCIMLALKIPRLSSCCELVFFFFLHGSQSLLHRDKKWKERVPVKHLLRLFFGHLFSLITQLVFL